MTLNLSRVFSVQPKKYHLSVILKYEREIGCSLQIFSDKSVSVYS